jgi:hypothetical protein
MTLAHIAALYFSGKREMAKKRVQKLKAAGLIRERPKRLPTDPSIHFLGKKAFELLRDNGQLADYPEIGLADLERRAQVSDQTLRHELEVMNVKTAMVTGINTTNNSRVVEFSTWPLLHEFKACRPDGERVTVKPDGFLRVHAVEEGGVLSEYTFFLEVDRSTESLNVLCKRCYCYRDYYRTGEFAIRCGQNPQYYRDFPFRVLIVCTSNERKSNVVRSLLLLDQPIHTQCLVITKSQLIADMYNGCVLWK